MTFLFAIFFRDWAIAIHTLFLFITLIYSKDYKHNHFRGLRPPFCLLSPIATLTGTKYPDEFIVLGGHFDSLTWVALEPRADDNASGTSGVIEIARILSQYEFDRAVIFCAFSGKEYGLHGSEAYAER